MKIVITFSLPDDKHSVLGIIRNFDGVTKAEKINRSSRDKDIAKMAYIEYSDKSYTLLLITKLYEIGCKQVSIENDKLIFTKESEQKLIDRLESNDII